jgi:hypothetical protein
MPLPIEAGYLLLNYSRNGLPFVAVPAPRGIQTNNLEYAYEGLPIIAANPNTLVTIACTETLGVQDSVFTNPTPGAEQPALADFTEVNINYSFTELLQPYDLGSAKGVREDHASVQDSFAVNIVVSIEETLSTYEQTKLGIPPIPVTEEWGVRVAIEQAEDFYYGTNVRISEAHKDLYGTEIDVQSYNPISVVNATAIDNPFQGSLAVQGTTIYAFPGNPLPSDTSKSNVYFTYRSAGLTGISLCNLYNYGFTLDYGGGHWEATSNIPLGTGPFSSPPQAVITTLGQKVQMFGLNATITEAGRVRNNSADGYHAAGIFGNPLLNKQLNLVLFGNNVFQPLMLSPTYRPPSSYVYATVKAAAMALFQKIGANASWSIGDAPYNSTLQEAGQTVGDALNSLASRLGGVIMWDGNNTYRVSYPDVFQGTWNVPDCHVIAAGGLDYTNYEDLETGMLFSSSLPMFFSGVSAVPTGPNASSMAGGTQPFITQIGKVSKKLTSDDPPVIFDLPQDYDKVYIQILVGTTGDTGGSIPIDIVNYVTKDPTQWFEFDVASLGSSYIFKTEIGGTLIPQVKVDQGVMPQPNSSIDNNNFTLSLACSRKNLGKASTAIPADLAAQQNTYRFFKKQSGRINCMFFGSIPLPGMFATATLGNLTVRGIIQSVQFSSPGFLTVDVASFSRLIFIGNLSNIFWGSAPSTTELSQ